MDIAIDITKKVKDCPFRSSGSPPNEPTHVCVMLGISTAKAVCMFRGNQLLWKCNTYQKYKDYV